MLSLEEGYGDYPTWEEFSLLATDNSISFGDVTLVRNQFHPKIIASDDVL